MCCSKKEPKKKIDYVSNNFHQRTALHFFSSTPALRGSTYVRVCIFACLQQRAWKVVTPPLITSLRVPTPFLNIKRGVCVCVRTSLCVSQLSAPENQHRQKTVSDWPASTSGRAALSRPSFIPLVFSLSFIPVLRRLPFLKFSLLLSVCHLCHLFPALHFFIPSFASFPLALFDLAGEIPLHVSTLCSYPLFKQVC